MYCRNCGDPISEKEMRCLSCNTTNSEGVDYCNVCGGYTTERMEYCKECGAKLKTIVPKKIRAERYKAIQKQVNTSKKIQGFLKLVIAICVIVIAVILFVFATQEEPTNIPDPPSSSTLSPNASVHDTLLKVGNTYYYSSDISEEVVEYWLRNRQMMGYGMLSVFVLFGTFISLLVEKSKYKKLLKALKEAKNVL